EKSEPNGDASAEFNFPLGMPTLETATSPSGTPALMAPEQTKDSAEDIGPWTDVYLLGGTLYAILTGSYPHAAPNSREAMAKAKVGFVPRPEHRAPRREIPPELSELCMRALAADPACRVPSA